MLALSRVLCIRPGPVRPSRLSRRSLLRLSRSVTTQADTSVSGVPGGRSAWLRCARHLTPLLDSCTQVVVSQVGLCRWLPNFDWYFFDCDAHTYRMRTPAQCARHLVPKLTSSPAHSTGQPHREEPSWGRAPLGRRGSRLRIHGAPPAARRIAALPCRARRCPRPHRHAPAAGRAPAASIIRTRSLNGQLGHPSQLGSS